MAIKCVWIEEGCIACGSCPVIAPDIFIIPLGDGYEDAVIRGDVRLDGRQGPNRNERSPLLAQIGINHQPAIEEAAYACPVEVIRYTAC